MPNHKYRIMNIVGARPNLVKMAPLIRAMRRIPDLDPVLVHTGQHYDYLMSQVFFEQLGMSAPDYNLEVGSGSQHEQTAAILQRFGELVRQDRPEMVVVVGDVNSTIACSLVAAKERIPLAHVEAGLRSGDRTMPEEINRLLTDAISDLLFTTEESGNVNLAREGVPAEKVFFVGNIMIDSLVHSMDAARESALLAKLELPRRGYGVLTLHRPANVDDADKLRAVLAAMVDIAGELPVLFPVHPRTQVRIASAGIEGMHSWDGERAIQENGVWMMGPAPYLDFLGIVDGAAFVITDSGGIQEESTFMGVPCLTFRDNTERPATIQHGTNRLVGTDPAALILHAKEVLREAGSGQNSVHAIPPLWDGHAAERIVEILHDSLQSGAARSCGAGL
ncbi:MAG: UDP-N-acetylglucosamine 2-epimerase (non-hydrolyzing) [Terracidiphilus sp.]